MDRSTPCQGVKNVHSQSHNLDFQPSIECKPFCGSFCSIFYNYYGSLIDLQEPINFRCTSHWFSTFIFYKMTPMISLVTVIMSPSIHQSFLPHVYDHMPLLILGRTLSNVESWLFYHLAIFRLWCGNFLGSSNSSLSAY